MFKEDREEGQFDWAMLGRSGKKREKRGSDLRNAMINKRYVDIQGHIFSLDVSFEGQNACFKEDVLHQMRTYGMGRMVLTA